MPLFQMFRTVVFALQEAFDVGGNLLSLRGKLLTFDEFLGRQQPPLTT